MHDLDKKNTITLCMIVCNEAANLSRCLNSVTGLVDEIIMIDTGSSDQTPDLAKKAGAQVYFQPWQEDFSLARNFGLEKAQGKWILVLDADEVLETDSAVKLYELIAQDNPADGYLLPIKSFLPHNKGEWQTSLVLRLFKNTSELRYSGKIHEQITFPEGKKLGIAENGPVIIHDGYQDPHNKKRSRNQKILETVLINEPDNPYYHFYYGTELLLQQKYQKAGKHIAFSLNHISNKVFLFRAAAVRNAVICLTEAGLYDDALDLVNAEIQVHDNYPDYYFFLGNLYRQKNNFKSALACYNTALNIKNPPLVGCSISGVTGFKTLYNKGLCLEKMRRYDEATRAYKAALMDNPGFHQPMSNLMKCILLTFSYEEVMSYLRENFQISSPDIQLLVSRSLFAGGYSKGAIAYISDIKPASPAGQLLLGEIYLAQKQFENADTYFKKIPKENKLYPTGLVFQCLGHWFQNKPVPQKLFDEFPHNQSWVLIKELLEYLNDIFFCTSRIRKSKGIRKIITTCSQFSENLFVKMLDLKMYSHARIVGIKILKEKPSLKLSLSYHCTQKALHHHPMFKFLFNRAVKGPESFLHQGNIHLRLADEYIQKIPLI